MFTILIIVSAFVGVAALVTGVAMVFRGQSDARVDDRLQLLTAGGGRGAPREAEKLNLLSSPLDDLPNVLEQFFARFGNLRKFLAQADSRMSPTKFLVITLGLAGGGAGLCLLTPLPM